MLMTDLGSNTYISISNTNTNTFLSVILAFACVFEIQIQLQFLYLKYIYKYIFAFVSIIHVVITFNKHELFKCFITYATSFWSENLSRNTEYSFDWCRYSGTIFEIHLNSLSAWLLEVAANKVDTGIF